MPVQAPASRATGGAWPASLAGNAHAALLAPFLPRLARWRADLRAGFGALDSSGDRPALDLDVLEESLAEQLARRWLWMCSPTLVLELHCARELGELEGGTSEERFRSFIEMIADPARASARLAEYGVLVEQIEDRARQALDASLETASRWAADRDALRRAFFGGHDPGVLVGLDARAGDAHADGRAVAILGFDSGAKLVYKPRPLGVDAHFQGLLAWLNDHGAPRPFQTLQVLDRGDYGWMEFAVPAPCADAGGMRRYHERLGALLAVLHALRAVDLHLENLIAAGEHPIAVDLETLFHPTPPSVEARPPAERAVTDALDESVLRVGMLPYRVGDEAGFLEADLSGVAVAEGVMAPDPVIRWENVGRDDMRAEKVALPLAFSPNRPTLAGVAADATDFAAEIGRGFAAMTRALGKERAALLAPHGPLARFADDRVRVVLRPTRVYGLLLDGAWHPDLLRTHAARERFFERLRIAGDAPELEAVQPFERRDLFAGDVPLFWTRPGRRDLWSSRGERLADFFAESPFDAVRRRLDRLTERDIAREEWLVRASLAMDALNRDRGGTPTLAPEPEIVPMSASELRSRLLASADEIGRWFERMAVGDDQRATWVALDFRAMQWTVNAAATDLYSGTPGIVLFLAHLGALGGDAGFTRLARRGVRSWLERLDRADGPTPERGLFQGVGGTMYALTHLAQLWRDPSLLAAAEACLDFLSGAIDGDEELDVVAGGAGVLAALLALERAGGSPRALELAGRCGAHLLVRARKSGASVTWTNALSGDRPATGFSHGASGIAFVLLRLARRTGDRAARDAALAALRSESAYLAPQIERWTAGGSDHLPGSRSHDAEKTLSTSWCHGLTGLALARAEAAADDESLAREAAAFARVVGEHGFGRSHCLCHGDLGTLEVLGLVSSRLADEAIAGPVTHRATVALAQAAVSGWRCGTMSGLEAPGLMNGLAGIGYGLLRLADPAHVPSILALDPPG